MADRYWVGGTAAWDGTAGTKWSATSGGAGGASVPTAADDVFFDAASGSGSVSISIGNTGAKSINCTGFTGTITGTAAITVSGSITLSAGMSWTHSTGNVSIDASGTLTTAGKSFSPVVIATIGGTVTLGDDFTSTGAINLSTGTFNTNNFNVTATVITSGNSNTRTINLGSSLVTLTGVNALNFAIITGFTFNAGSSTIICTNSSVTLSLGNTTGTVPLTLNNIQFTSTSTGTITINGLATGTDGATFNDFIVAASTTPGIKEVVLNNNILVNGVLGTTGTAGNERIWFRSNTYGVSRTLRVNGSTSLSDCDFRDILAGGSAAPFTGTRLGNRGANAKITFSTPKTVYWNLAGSQTWATANAWAATSGGTPNTDNYPLPQDTAVFDNAGAVGTVQFAGGEALPTVNMSARTTGMTIAVINAITCYGSWVNGSGTTITNTSILTFSGEGTKTITSASKTFSCDVTIDAYGGTVELIDAFNCGSRTLTITNGTFDTKGFAVSCVTLSSNNSNVRTIKLNNSTINASINGGAIQIGGANLTLDAGSSQINITGTGTFSGGGYTYNNVTFTSAAGTRAINDTNNSFNNLTITAPGSSILAEFTVGGDQTITGTLNINAGTIPVRRTFFRSNVIGTTRTLTCNAVASLTDIDFRDITITGPAAPVSGTRIGDGGGNSGITFPAPKTVYWNLAGTQNWSATAWATSSGGTPDINNFPLAQDTAVFDNTGAVTGAITINSGWNIGTFDASARTSAMSLSCPNAPQICGSWINGTGLTLSGIGTLGFVGRGASTIISAGVVFTQQIVVDNIIGSVTLQDSLTSNRNTSSAFRLLSGTFDANGYSVTLSAGGFDSSNSAARTLKMGSGLWTLGIGGSVWDTSTTVNFNFFKDTADILLSNTSTSSRTFSGGGLSYNKLTIGGATGISSLTLGGANQFTELASTKTVAHTIVFPSSTVTTIGKWSVTGTAGNVVTLSPSSAATTYTISIVGSAPTGIDYLSISYFALLSSSPAEFFAGANSTNGAGNTGVTFTAPPTPRTLYWVGGTGNWSNTARWSLTSGGAGGQAVPTSLDNVIFNSASNATAYTATIDVVARCNEITISGPASGNVTLAGSQQFIAHGNITLPATGFTRTFSSGIILSGSTAGKTYTTNGVTMANNTTVNGIGCEWSLGSNLNNATAQFTVTNGTFNTANFVFTTSNLVSNNTNSRTINLGTSTVNLGSSGSALDFTNTTNLTFNAGSSQINITSTASPSFISSGQIFNNVSVTAAGTSATFIGQNTFNNLSMLGRNSAGVTSLIFGGNQTINGTLTLSPGINATARTFVRSDTIGTTRTLTCNAVSSLTDIDFRDITIAGNAVSGGNLTGTRLGDCKGNTGITFGAPKTVYYRDTGSSNWGATTWAFTNGGTADITAFPLAQDTAVFPSSPTPYPSSGSQVTINFDYNIGTIDMSARTTNTMILSNGINPTIYGNWINGTGTVNSSAGSLFFAGRGSQTITSAGSSFTQIFIFDSPGGSVTLQDAFVISNASSNSFNLYKGTFDANGYNVSIPNGGVSLDDVTTPRILAVGSGTWIVGGSGTTAWDAAPSTGLTVTGTGTIKMTSSSTKSFVGGNLNYSGITLEQAGSGTLTITGNNSFANITNTVVGPTTIALGTTTQRVGAFTATGTAGNPLTITGNTSNIIYTGGGAVGAGTDYLIVAGRAYGPNGETSGIWYAGNNSINSGTLGWQFVAGGSIIFDVVITEAYTSAETQDTVANIFNSAITENSILADEQVPTGVYGVTITENSTLADSSTPAAILYVSVTEPTTLADFQEFVNLIAVSITEGSILGDSSNSDKFFTATVSEGLTSAETQSATSTFFAVLVENSTVNNTQTVQAVFAGSRTEGVISADVTNATGSFGVSILEVLTSLSQENVSLSTNAAITEGVEVTDGKELVDWLNNSSDIVNWLNNSSDIVYWGVFGPRAVLVRFVDQAENVTVADLSNRQATLSALINEALAAAGTQSASATFNSLIAENMLVSDQTVGYGWFRVVDDQTASWTSVDNSQSIVWTNIGDAQNPNWVEIDNKQP